ncbi:MAG: N-acyl homoserine lactonase family protein [Lachnospiraceae bacterium]|nr:N-acyl homoserine lactonase family protein [Lachnospiraceae bacterium]
MKLYVLDLGKIVMMNDNPVTKGSEEHPAIPIHAFLLDTSTGKILFDTGCVPDCMDGAWPEAMCSNPYVPSPGGDLIERLAQVGAAPEDVDYVVLSHLHLDHAGAVHLFPNAKAIVSKDEYTRVMEDAKEGTLGIFHLPCDLKNWEDAKVNWELIDARETKLSEEVTILNFGPGHSYGMLGLLVKLSNKNVLLVSDAVYSAIHYGPPAQLAGVVQDEEGYFATIEQIRRYAEEYQAEVLYGHDMPQFLSLIKGQDGFYE